MWIPKIFSKNAPSETIDNFFLYKDKSSGAIGFFNKNRQFISIGEKQEVLFFTDFSFFPQPGKEDLLYVDKLENIVYIFNTVLNNYVAVSVGDEGTPTEPIVGKTYYVRLAPSAPLNACTYDNGTAGVGATLTGDINGILSQNNQPGLVDNTVPELGDIILLYNQSSRKENGIYEVTQLGDGSNLFILTRVAEYDQEAEVYPSIVFVSAGSSNINKYFSQVTPTPITIGTTNLVYQQATVALPAPTILFVDTITDGVLPNSPVYASGTAYSNAPGFGATLTSNSFAALGTINGVSMTSGRRVVVKDQVNQAHNGLYEVVNPGNVTSQKWQLKRVGADGNAFYRVREYVVSNPNSDYYGTRWSISSPLTMANSAWGTTNIVFSALSNSSQNIATNDLVFTANSTTDLAGYKATLDNAELKIVADGNDPSDIPFEVTQANGTDSILKVQGDKALLHSGGTFHQNTADYNLYHRLTSTGQIFNEMYTPGAAAVIRLGAFGDLSIQNTTAIGVNPASISIGSFQYDGGLTQNIPEVTRTTASISFFAGSAGQIEAVNSKFKISSPGDTSGDTAFEVTQKNNGGASIIKALGNKEVQFGTELFINSALGGFYVQRYSGAVKGVSVFHAGTGNGVESLTAGGVAGEFINNGTSYAVRATSNSNPAIYATSTSNYSVQAAGNLGYLHQLSGNSSHFGINIRNNAGTEYSLGVRGDGYVFMETLKNSSSYADDPAAAAGGVPVGALYRNGSVVQIRLV